MKLKAPPRDDVWPKLIRHGNASVKLYKVLNKGRQTFTLAFKGRDGKRTLRQFSDEKAAKQEAETTARRLHEGELQILQLKDADRFVYIAALNALKPTGKRLDLAVSEYVEASTILKGASLIEAARFFAKQTGEITKISVSKGADEFIRYVEQKKRSAVYLKDLRYRIALLTKTFGSINIDSLGYTEISLWLNSLKTSSRSRDNALRVLITFLKFCQRQRYLPKGGLPTDDIEAFTDNEDGEIQIFTPTELDALLKVASREVLPYLVLGAFAGIRTAEIKRLSWSDIDLAAGYIEIKAKNAKTRQRRLIRIQPNLAAWLATLIKPSGPVSDLERPEKTVQQIYAEKAKVSWKRNGLRHSYISYRMAATNDENMVSSEAGNSPAIVFKNYRQLVKPEQATAWFQLMPAPTP